ncbi:MAG: hypothetical protein JKY70_13170 [Mucilaginibacter sp.]|nr:hypothetical protein [Mucilaginibacter sp.]
MISTLYFLQLIAFLLWQLSSKQTKLSHSRGILKKVTANPKPARLTGGLLCTITLVLFIIKLGLFSGVCAAIVGLMGVGCLSLVLQPFNYLRWSSVMALYAIFLILEILI